jgi:glycosyltransferase involved in cell wall biosynthesis
MRILHVTRSIDPAMGGPVEFLRLVTEAHAEQGVSTEVVTLDAPDSPFFDGWPVCVTGRGPGAGVYGRRNGFKSELIRIAKKFDAIVVHGLWQYHGLCVRRLAEELTIPYYVFPHGMLDHWFKKQFPIKHLKKQLYWWAAERRILQSAERVLFTAEFERRRSLQTFWPSVRYRSAILPLGVKSGPKNVERDIALFYDRFPERRGRPFILFLGRLHPKKGCDLAIKGIGRLDLVVAGPEEDLAYVRRLKQYATGLAVTFAGQVQGALKIGALAAADVLILPSHQENFGMVIAEALSFGLPVLISNQVPMADEIEARGAGFMEADTLEGVKRLIQRWSSADQAAMRHAARRCFEELFDIRRTATTMLEIMGQAGQESIDAHRVQKE